MRGRNYAWVVLVPNVDSLELALLSGKLLRKTNTSAAVLALVASSVFQAKTSAKELQSTFEAVLTVNPDSVNDDCNSGSMLAYLLKSTVWSKLVVLQPGVLVLEQYDDLFDSENGFVFLNENGEDWSVLEIRPNLKKFEALNRSKMVDWKEVCEVVLGKDWKKYVSGHVGQQAYPKGPGPGHHPKVTQLGNKVKFGQQEIERAFSLSSSVDSSKIFGKDVIEDTKDWVAIVGMSCRFPQANSVEEYWELLKEGRNTCQAIPSHRLKLAGLVDSPTAKDLRGNLLKCPIDQFDASFFGMSPSEASICDPQARLLLETSWEAFENAGINPDQVRGSSTGVFYGSWVQEYKEALISEGSAPGYEYVRKYLANSFGCAASKLSFFYGLTGPNIATESGCSSSVVAIDLACKSLQNGECPLALAAGANVIVHLNMKQKAIWSNDSVCKTFDANSNGYGRAEGVAVLVLKRYSDALRDYDRIHGIVRGTGTSQEGLTRSFGTPTVESEAKAMKEALQQANLSPAEVDYVEAHATGTAVGDPVEAAAIVQAYFSDLKREKPLLIGSGKTNIGHTESCSGMAGIIKVLLAMKHEFIPPHINLETLNPLVDFSLIPGTVPVKGSPWPRNPNRVRIAGVSSFGITGTDVHVILQEPPEATASTSMNASLTAEILAWSAKSETALEELSKSYFSYLESNRNVSVSDVAYMTNACRSHHPFRKSVVVRKPTQANEPNLIQNSINFNGKAKSGKPKICFTFPPGNSKINWEPARKIYNGNPNFRSSFHYAADTYKSISGRSILPLFNGTCSPKTEESEYIIEWLACSLAVQYALVKLFESWGIQPDCVIGHCIGEVGAAVVSGALSLENGFKVLMSTSHIIHAQKINPAEMMAVSMDHVDVLHLMEEFVNENPEYWIDICCCNSPHQTVVTAPPATCDNFKEFLQQKEIKCMRLGIGAAGHCRVLQDAFPALIESYSKLQNIQQLRYPYISSSTGRIVETSQLGPEFWYNCWRNPVQFMSACDTANEEIQADIYLEINVEPTLTKFTKENLKNSSLSPISIFTFHKKGEDGWFGLLSTLAQLYTSGCNINWTNFYKLLGHQRRVVDLPQYPFQRKSFWFKKKLQNLKSDSSLESKTQISTGEIENLDPLLGGYLPNETCRPIFQSSISDEDPQTNYIYDHVVGTEVIFPGACFLHMITAGGYYSLKLDKRDDDLLFGVTDFFIKSPLHLQRSSTKKLQTILETNTNHDVESFLKGSVFAQNENNEWSVHATAEFLHCPVNDEILPNLLISNIKERCSLPVGSDYIEEFYSRVSSVGLNFGAQFRSLNRVYKGDDEILVEVPIPNGSEDYLCHPILIDAMIQTFLLVMQPEFNKLHVPVKIGRFVCSPKKLKNISYVYCKKETSGIALSIFLLAEDGLTVASMTNLELVPTSIHSVLNAAMKTKMSQPPLLDIFETVWTPCSEFDSVRIAGMNEDTSLMSSQKFQSLLKDLDFKNKYTGKDKVLDELVNRLCYLFVLKCLYDLGWKGEMNQVYSLDNMAVSLGVKPSLRSAFSHFMSYMVQDGDFLIMRKGCYRLKKSLPKEAQVLSEINTITVNEHLKTYPALEVVLACGEQLSELLTGKVKATQVMFGEYTGGNNRAEIYYKATRFHDGMFENPAQCFAEIVRHMWKQRGKISTSSDENTLRILEVGGGTGTFTMKVLTKLEQIGGVNYQYFFTDISSSFFARATTKFEKYSKSMVFKAFDIEKDPLKQGFPSGYFDVVVGVDVVHATTNIRNSLQNLQMVTRDGGRILLGETNIPVREADIVFGPFEGYWIFEDKDVREKGHCTIPTDKWIKLLAEIGFTSDPCAILSCDNQMSIISAQLNRSEGIVVPQLKNEACEWILCHDKSKDDDLKLSKFLEEMKKVGRNVSIMSLNTICGALNAQNLIQETLQEKGTNLEGVVYWLEGEKLSSDRDQCKYYLAPLLYISKYFLKSKMQTLPKLIAATNRVWLTEEPVHGLNPALATVWGYLRTLRIEMNKIVTKTIEFDSEMDEEDVVRSLVQELWLKESNFENEISYRDSTRLVRRLLKDDWEGINVALPKGERFRIQLPKTKLMSDLSYVKDEKLCVLEDGQVEIEVKCTSLNFRDVFTVIKPIEQLQIFGLDYAGVLSRVGENEKKWKVGDAVFGCNWDEGAMKSHLVTGRENIMSLPEALTFAEGATLPSVFFTAWHCMVNIADLRAGQTLLVHAASGGMGLIVIQIAKLLGVNVIGTAGSQRKRSFVRSLGVEHVYSSRTLEFRNKIMEVTGGKGVDMVLNCLTGPGFKEASLDVCRVGGHFVEISKLDIWQPHEVQERKPGVNYEVMCVSQVPKHTILDMMKRLTNLLKDGKIKPLPYTRFDASKVVDAISYLQKAKHIGKVVVNLPKFDSNLGKMKEYIFNDRSTYLITGGRGSIGFSVARWMVSQGAKYLVLVGRSLPDEKLVKAIEEMKSSNGCRIINLVADVGNYNECKELFDKIKSTSMQLPPLRGVHHCSGVLSDKLIGNQDWDNFEVVLHPKLKGSYNLHLLTQETTLEFFCLYSSLACTFGNYGQSNYSAASAYMDSLAQMRRSMGLAGVALNLGHWRGGLATNLDVPWAPSFSADEGISALDYIFRTKLQTNGLIGMGRLNLEGLLKMLPFYEKTLLENVQRPLLSELNVFKGPRTQAPRIKTHSTKGSVGNESMVKKNLLDLYRERAEKKIEERRDLVRTHVISILCETLGLKENEIEDDNLDFQIMGVDSLMSIEFTNRLLSDFGENSNIFIDVGEYGTITKMTDMLTSIIESHLKQKRIE